VAAVDGHLTVAFEPLVSGRAGAHSPMATAFVQVRRRAQSRLHLTWILFAWGCTVYQPGLLGDVADSSSGGKAGRAAGEAGSSGRADGAAGLAGTSSDGGSNVAGSNAAGGTVGGNAAAGAGAGATSTSAGADAVGDGGAMACVSETVAEFCKRVGKDCGGVDDTDNCGTAVVGANCGSCNGFKTCSGGGQDNVCGALTDPAKGGIATASSVGSIGETGSKAFDLDANTKWYAGDSSATGWLAFQFTGTTSHVVHSYSVTSGNDFASRDPTAWQLQGSNNGGTWVTVDQRTAQVFANRHQTNSYTCAGTTAYRFYRLLVTANNGSSALQVAELVLYGD
jgi:F5/8 type C domain